MTLPEVIRAYLGKGGGLTPGDLHTPSVPQVPKRKRRRIDDFAVALKPSPALHASLRSILSKYREDQLREQGRFAYEGRGEGGAGTTTATLAGQDAVTLVSPNRTDLSFNQAVTSLRSFEQRRLEIATKLITRKLGLKARVMSGLGAWADGAEPMAMTALRTRDYEAVKRTAAMQGLLAEQKAVIPFVATKNGKDRLIRVRVRGSNVFKLHSDLLAAGVEHHTIVPRGDHTDLLIFNQGSDRAVSRRVRNFTEKNHGKSTILRGRGEFLGSWTSREEGARIYREVVGRGGSGVGGGSGGTGWYDRLHNLWRSGQTVIGKLDAFLKSLLFKGEWREEDHPRNPGGMGEESGRFAVGGGGGVAVGDAKERGTTEREAEGRKERESAVNAMGPGRQEHDFGRGVKLEIVNAGEAGRLVPEIALVVNGDEREYFQLPQRAEALAAVEAELAKPAGSATQPALGAEVAPQHQRVEDVQGIRERRERAMLLDRLGPDNREVIFGGRGSGDRDDAEVIARHIEAQDQRWIRVYDKDNSQGWRDFPVERKIEGEWVKDPTADSTLLNDYIGEEAARRWRAPTPTASSQGDTSGDTSGSQQVSYEPKPVSSYASHPKQPPVTVEQKALVGKTPATMKRLDTDTTSEIYKIKFEDGSAAKFKPFEGEDLSDGVADGVPRVKGAQALREVAAYEISGLLGVKGMVPPSVIAKVNNKPGALQPWLEGAEPGDMVDAVTRFAPRVREKAFLYSYVIGQGDLHHNNFMAVGDQIQLVDNGLAFPINRERGLRLPTHWLPRDRDTPIPAAFKKPLKAPKALAKAKTALRKRGMSAEVLKLFEERWTFAEEADTWQDLLDMGRNAGWRVWN